MGAPEVLVRSADGDDLERIVAVGRTAMKASYERAMEPEMLDLLVAKFWTAEANIDAIRAGRTFVAEVEGDVVAMCAYGLQGGRPVVWKLYVLPEYQARGIGRRLLDAVIDRLAFDHTHIHMPIQDGNESGFLFARGAGLKEFEREQQSGMPDLVWMRKRLREDPT